MQSQQEITSLIPQSENRYVYKSIKYWCHLCRKPFNKLKQANVLEEISCPLCDQTAAEEIDPQNPPQEFVVYDAQESLKRQQQQQQQQQHQQQQQQNNNRNNNRQQNQGQNRFTRRIVVSPGFMMEEVIGEPENVDHQQQQFQFPFFQMPLFQGSNRQQQQNQNNDSQNFFGFNGNPFNLFNFFGNQQQFGQNARSFEDILQEIINNDPNNYGPAPAEKEKIQKLQNIQVDKNSNLVNEQCSICQSNYEAGENVNQLPCNHKFHKDCVGEWLSRHNSCPICRKSI